MFVRLSDRSQMLSHVLIQIHPFKFIFKLIFTFGSCVMTFDVMFVRASHRSQMLSHVGCGCVQVWVCVQGSLIRKPNHVFKMTT